MLIYLGMQVLVTIVAVCVRIIPHITSLVMANNGAIPDPAVYAEFIESTTAWAMGSSSFFLLIACVLCLAPFLPIWHKTPKVLVHYEEQKPALLLLFSVVAFWGFNMLLSFIFDITDITRFFPSYENIIQALSGGSLAIRFLAIVIAGPFIEELCFRGIILNRLQAWTGKWTAVLIQALLFGLVHLNLFQGLYAAIFGFALGYLYVRFRKLWLCVAGHMAFNSIAFMLMFLDERGAEISTWSLLPGVIIFAAGAYFLAKQPPAMIIEAPADEEPAEGAVEACADVPVGESAEINIHP